VSCLLPPAAPPLHFAMSSLFHFFFFESTPRVPGLRPSLPTSQYIFFLRVSWASLVPPSPKKNASKNTSSNSLVDVRPTPSRLLPTVPCLGVPPRAFFGWRGPRSARVFLHRSGGFGRPSYRKSSPPSLGFFLRIFRPVVYLFHDFCPISLPKNLQNIFSGFFSFCTKAGVLFGYLLVVPSPPPPFITCAPFFFPAILRQLSCLGGQSFETPPFLPTISQDEPLT